MWPLSLSLSLPEACGRHCGSGGGTSSFSFWRLKENGESVLVLREDRFPSSAFGDFRSRETGGENCLELIRPGERSISPTGFRGFIQWLTMEDCCPKSRPNYYFSAMRTAPFQRLVGHRWDGVEGQTVPTFKSREQYRRFSAHLVHVFPLYLVTLELTLDAPE